MSSQARIPHFDLIRTIAVISVVVSHIFSEENSYLEGQYALWSSPAFQILRAPISTGGYGVALFLLLSGVLISRFTAHETICNFAIRRILRIYPLYLVMLLGRYLTYLTTTDSPDWRIPVHDLIGLVTLLGDFWNTPLFLGQVDWSLRVEIVAYLLVAVSLAIVNSEFRTLLLTGLSAVLAIAPPIPTELISAGYLNVHLPLFVAGFCLGAQVQGENKGGWRRLNQVLVFVNIVLIAIAANTHRPDLSDSLQFNTNIVAAITTFLLIIRFQPQTTVSIIRKLSEASYGIYLMHNWLVYVLAEQLVGNTGLLGRVIGLLMIMFFARLLFVYFEVPIIHFSKQITTHTTKSSARTT